MKTYDKFGRYRGFHGGVGPKGLGFGLDKHGNYDMRKRQVKRVGKPSDMDDAVTLELVKRLYGLIEENTADIAAIPKKLGPLLGEYFENYKEEKLVPLIDRKIGEYREEVIFGINKLPDHINDYIEKHKNEKLIPLINTTFDNKLKDKKLKIGDLEREVEQIKKDAQNELKSIAEMTRAFVYKVTSPGYTRNSEAAESNIHTKLQDKNSSWRHAFPEVTKKGS